MYILYVYYIYIWMTLSKFNASKMSNIWGIATVCHGLLNKVQATCQ
jgi:uncharacterized membrane protein YdbT with pleckstrin-like domain